MKRTILTGVVLVLATMTAAPDALAQRGRKAAAELAAMRGEMLAQSCFACHGPRGGSGAEGVPSIGGQNAAYLVTSMLRFKVPDRPASVMTRLANGYSDAEIEAIAAYISRLPFERLPQAYDADLAARGEATYSAVCRECHVNGGRESELSDYPIIAGQRLRYLQMQMYEIHVSGRRGVDAKFSAQLAKLSAAEIEAALHYFAAQR
jgi:sulfide dehydrogenase cytochrome subunit